MMILTVFFLFLFALRSNNYGLPNQPFGNITFREKCNFTYVAITNYTVPNSVNAAVILPYAANTALDRSGNLLSGRTTYIYSEKPSSTVTTRRDVKNQVFLATHCDCLRGLFISLHSLSVNGSSSIAPGETIRSRHFALRTAQGRQHTVHFAYGVN